MTSTLNRDVWIEILKHFEILPNDDAAIVRSKKRVVLSVALTCPKLTDTALTVLWKSMTTLEPITSVLNASSSTALLTFQRQGHWEISPPPELAFGTIIPRMHQYLSRIRYLHFASFPSPRERALWQTLVSLGNVSFLCPNLQGLSLSFGISAANVVYCLTALISPALKSISFTNTPEELDEIAASILLGTCSYRSADLLHISYQGYTSQRIIKPITHFPGLRSLSIHSEMPAASSPGSPQLHSLRGLDRLTSLTIHLDMLPSGSEGSDILTALKSLTALHLSGSWPQISNACINHTFSTVHSLTFLFDLPTKPRSSVLRTNNPTLRINSSTLFSLLSSSFPELRSLSIQAKRYEDSAWNTSVALNDIFELRNKTMECLELRNVRTTLSTSDIIEIVKTWPMLKHLSISTASEGGVFTALPTLTLLSHHGARLQTLLLPLNFLGLDGLTYQCGLDLPRCPLRKLELFEPKNIPTTMQGRLALARNLVMLFPKLEAVAPVQNEAARDLDAIVQTFQELLAFPPKFSGTTC